MSDPKCPWCGREWWPRRDSIQSGDEFDRWRMECTCGARGPLVTSKDAALAAARTPEPAVPAPEAAIRAKIGSSPLKVVIPEPDGHGWREIRERAEELFTLDDGAAPYTDWLEMEVFNWCRDHARIERSE